MNVAKDIRTIADLQRNPTQVLQEVNRSCRPMVITMDGEPAALLLSPKLFPSKKIALSAACELTDPGT